MNLLEDLNNLLAEAFRDNETLAKEINDGKNEKNKANEDLEALQV